MHNSIDSAQQKKKLTFSPSPVIKTKKNNLHDLLKRIPLLSGLVDNLNLADDSVNQILSFQHPSHGLEFTGLALTIFNFLRIPIVYIGAFLTGEKLPFTLSTATKWLYTGIVLTLLSLALSLPMIASPLFLTVATLGFTVSVSVLFKFYLNRSDLKAKLHAVKETDREEREPLNKLYQETKKLEEALAEAKNQSKPNSAELTQQLQQKNEEFNRLFAEKEQKLQSLCDAEAQLNQKLQLKNKKIFHRCLTTSLSALLIAGLVTSLFFPLIGFGIVATSAVLGGTYFITAISSLILQKHALRTAAISNKSDATISEPLAFGSGSIETAHESTASLAIILAQGDSEEAINKLKGHPIPDTTSAHSTDVTPTHPPLAQPISPLKKENLPANPSPHSGEQTHLSN